MKLSRLILEAQNLLDTHGDIDVIQIIHGQYESVDVLEFNASSDFLDHADGEFKVDAPTAMIY